ncbi:MAG TPA: hypothetical protein VH302_12370 [Bryobacteraceae bacterium]|jgi:hypothetical protein|nr:hypothetical protein [Bryobacteraceae bacterium]
MEGLTHLTVRAKVIGRRDPSFAHLELDPDEPLDSVRDLLAAVVRAELDNFKTRKENAQYLRLLTERDIENGYDLGKIVSGGQDADERAPSLEQAIDAVVTGFHDGLYYMFLNDSQVESLEQPVPAREVADVLFVRLTPLAGG